MSFDKLQEKSVNKFTIKKESLLKKNSFKTSVFTEIY